MKAGPAMHPSGQSPGGDPIGGRMIASALLLKSANRTSEVFILGRRLGRDVFKGSKYSMVKKAVS